MRNTALFVLSAPFALMACEQPPADTADTAPAAKPVAPSVAGAGRAIPARFLGVWDYAEGTCDPASDLRMEIEPRRIVFYESVGNVAAVEQKGADGVLVSMTMTGEGQSWNDTMRLDLDDNGAVLIPGDAEEYDPGQPLPRKRCP